MTTTPAMPELPEPFALSVSVHEGDTPAKTYVECMLYQKHPNEKQRLYTADQMRAYALATLQAQQSTQGEAQQVVTQAEVSDAEINRIACKAGFSAVDVEVNGRAFARFARAILALRPQAVPMTDEQFAQLLRKLKKSREVFQAGRDSYETACAPMNSDDEAWSAYLAHHGITAPAGGERQA